MESDRIGRSEVLVLQTLLMMHSTCRSTFFEIFEHPALCGDLFAY